MSGGLFHDFRHCPANAWAGRLSRMETIATITWSAAVTCVVALIGITWKHAQPAHEAA
jgi:hypothetical protein